MTSSQSHTPCYETSMFESFGATCSKLETLAMDLGLGMVSIVKLRTTRKWSATKYLLTEIDDLPVRISLGATMAEAEKALADLSPFFGPVGDGQEPDEVVEEVYIIRDLFDPELDADEELEASRAIIDFMRHAKLISWTETFEMRIH